MSADPTEADAVTAPLATITRDAAAGIAQRAGAAAITYYPEIHADELGFSLSSEIDWCLEDVTGLDEEDVEILRDAIARTIIDPSAHRSTLNTVLDVLTEAEAD